MRKLTLLISLISPLFLSATNYTSVKSGNWSDPATWGGGGFPNGPGDNAVISSGNAVYATDFQEIVGNLTVNGAISVGSTYFAVEGELINNGTVTGSNPLSIWGNGTALDGAGNWISYTGTITFRGSDQAISSSVNMNMPNGKIGFNSASASPQKLTNNGQLTVNSITDFNNPLQPCTWINATNSLLRISAASFPKSDDTLYASASGNTFVCTGTSSYNIPKTENGYYNLQIGNTGTKSLTADVTVLNTLLLFPAAVFNTAGHNITVGGNWTNNITSGSIQNLTGTVTFNGSASQTIGGTHTTSFANMTVSGSGTVNIATSCSFTGALTMSGTGNLASSGGKDTLISTSSATARIAQITGSGSITCGFIVQRYDGRTTAQYQTLSSPVQGATLGDWDNQTGFWMSGTGGNDGNTIKAGKVYYSVKKYNEVTNNFDSLPSDSYVLTPGLGVYLWMGNSLTGMSPYTYYTPGVPTQGAVNYAVTKTVGKGGGFNLIGNPYASPIDWAKFSATNSSLQSSYYLFEQDGSWHTFSSGSIPLGQGFGVVTNLATTLHFSESHKTATDASLLRAENPEDEANAVTFTLSDDVNAYSSPTIISFGQDNVTNYDMEEDALFIESPIHEVPELYTVSSDQQNLCLNRLPDNTNVVDVPLTATANVTGSYTLTAGNLYNLSAYNCICLIDRQTGAVLNNFEDMPTYTFPMEAGQQKDFIVRFKQLYAGEDCNTVTSTNALSNNADNIVITQTTNGAMVNFRLNQPENAVISVYNLMGQKVLNDINTNAYNNSVNVPLTSTQQLYIIKVITPDGMTVKKLYH